MRGNQNCPVTFLNLISHFFTIKKLESKVEKSDKLKRYTHPTRELVEIMHQLFHRVL